MAVVTMKSLLESGVHFGHQVKRWDPRMKKYIFAERNGIHIIDLQKTITAIKDSYDVVRKVASSGKSVLFVGTKKQAQQAIEKEAERCGMYYVNNRWLGGTLTNFTTIKKSLLRLKKIEKMEVDGTFDKLTKKEVAAYMKEKETLTKNYGGMKDMKELHVDLRIIDMPDFQHILNQRAGLYRIIDVHLLKRREIARRQIESLDTVITIDADIMPHSGQAE